MLKFQSIFIFNHFFSPNSSSIMYFLEKKTIDLFVISPLPFLAIIEDCEMKDEQKLVFVFINIVM